MGAFCVFGMTEAIAKKSAAQAWRKHVAQMTPEVRKHIQESDEKDWIAVKTEYLLAKGTPVQLSGAFDAPQFAQEFIRLATRQTRSSRLRVMTRGEKLDNQGAPRISKATKRPIIGWIPY